MQRVNNSRINKVRNKIKPSSKDYYKSVKHNTIFSILQLLFIMCFIFSLTQILKWCKLNEHTEEEKRLANSAIVYETGVYKGNFLLPARAGSNQRGTCERVPRMECGQSSPKSRCGFTSSLCTR